MEAATHPVFHVPDLAGAVEAFFAHRDLAPTTRRTYRQALDPLVDRLGAAWPLSDLDAELVAALFATRWADGPRPTVSSQ